MPRLSRLALWFDYEMIFGDKYKTLDNLDALDEAAEEWARPFLHMPITVGTLEIGQVVKVEINRHAERAVLYMEWHDDKMTVAQVL